MRKSYLAFVLLSLLLTSVGCTNNNSQQRVQTIANAIELIKNNDYQGASVALIEDVKKIFDRKDMRERSEVKDGLSKQEMTEVDLYNYASARETEIGTNYEMALSYLEYVQPIDGLVTQNDLTEMKTRIQAKNDQMKQQIKQEEEKVRQEEEMANSPEERKKRGVTVGMTQDDVLMSSWGEPKHINKTTTANEVSEQWVYGLSSYLYFEDGILTTIQN